MNRFFIEIPCTFIHTIMCADRTGDERKRVLLHDHFHRFLILAVAHHFQICRDILMDRASLFTRRHITVDQRNFLFHLAGRKWFHCFDMVRICHRVFRKFLRRFHIDSLKYDALFFQFFRHLDRTQISARLQQCGCKRYRPDPGIHDSLYIMCIRTAGIRNMEFSVEFFCQFRCKRDRKRIQRFSGHVHFFAWKFVLHHIHRECICDLHAEFQIPLLADFHQSCQHRNRILILQVIQKMEIAERYIIVAHLVHSLSCKFISQQRRITFDKCMEPFHCDQIHRDLFDLLRRTSVKRGDRHGITDLRFDRLDIFFCHFLKFIHIVQQILSA